MVILEKEEIVDKTTIQSQIGWIFKSTANDSYWFPFGPEFVEKPLSRERHVALFIYKCLTFDLSMDLRERTQSQGVFCFEELSPVSEKNGRDLGLGVSLWRLYINKTIV